MDAAASSSPRIRQLMPLILWSSGGLSVLVITALVLWIWLPRWAPGWVVRYSPWIDPVLRSAASINQQHVNQFLQDEVDERVKKWGASALPHLGDQLLSSHASERMTAAAALCPLGARAQLPRQVTEQLCGLAITDDHPQVRAWALFALAEQRSTEVSLIRAQAMTDQERDVRYAAVAGLDSRFSETDWNTLQMALSDSEESVRYKAIQRVRTRIDQRAVPRLLEMLNQEDGENFRQVLWTLREWKARESMSVLKGIIQRKDRQFHLDALLSTISKIDETEGFRAHVDLLGSDNPEMRAFVARKFGESPDDRAIEPLTKQLDDPDPLVFGYVVIALSQLKATSSIETILDRLAARRTHLINLETKQEEGIPIVSGRLMRITLSDIIDQVAIMPLTPEQRERLERLRED